MDSNEIKKEINMNYKELVAYLLNKYGPSKYDYFHNNTYKTKNKKVTRTQEGLFCHHIDEDKAEDLSYPKLAMRYPYEYQKADRLVYCNYLEHLLLHIQIGEDKFWKTHKELKYPVQFASFIVPGISFISKNINTLYKNNGSSIPWMNRCFKEIENNFDDYIAILMSFLKYITDHYTGKKSYKSINVGIKVKHKEWGEGVITEISNIDKELYKNAIVTVQFPKFKKYVVQSQIDKGDCDEALAVLKKRLSFDDQWNVVDIVFNRLKSG